MGLNVERTFGGSRFIATYLVSGIIGNVVSAIQSPNPAVGASGAIFGLVGAYYTFLSRNQDLFGYSGQMQKSQILETVKILESSNINCIGDRAFYSCSLF